MTILPARALGFLAGCWALTITLFLYGQAHDSQRAYAAGPHIDLYMMSSLGVGAR